MRAIASFIMRGRMQALMVVLLAAGFSMLIPPLLLFSGAAVGLVALRRGAADGVSVTLIAAAVMMGLLALTPVSPSVAMLYVVVVWGPVLIMGLMLRATISLAIVFYGAVFLAEAFLFAGLMLIPGDPGQWWYDNYLYQVYESILQAETVTAEQRAMMENDLRTAADYLTGYLAVGFASVSLMCILVARWWQALLYNPGGFRTEFHALRLGRRFGGIAAALILAGLLPLGEASALLGQMSAPILAFAGFQGLAVMHSVVARRGANIGWLVALYILLIFATIPVMFLLAVMAILDNWLDFRGRVPAGGPPPQEPGDE